MSDRISATNSHEAYSKDGIQQAACDAWSPETRSKVVRTAQNAFEKEIDIQINGCLSALWATPGKTIQKDLSALGAATSTGVEAISTVPDLLQIGIESLYNKPRADLHADQLGVKVRSFQAEGWGFVKAMGAGWSPVDKDLQEIGATGDYKRLVVDPAASVNEAVNDFSNQRAPKQIEDLVSFATDGLLMNGTSEAFDVLKSAQLLEKATAHLKRIDTALSQFRPLETLTADGLLQRQLYVFNGEKTQLSLPKAAERLNLKPQELKHLTETELNKLGLEVVNDYRETFFDKYPHLRPAQREIIVHHAIEQTVLEKYPGLFTAKEINGADNLRGIPKSANSELHLGEINREWRNFYSSHNPSATTREQFIRKAAEIDAKLGHRFSENTG